MDPVRCRRRWKSRAPRRSTTRSTRGKGRCGGDGSTAYWPLTDTLGPGNHTLTTENLPLLSEIVNLPFGGRSPFTAEVWFVNRAASLDVNWGTTDPIQVGDPKYRIIVPVRAYGQFGLRIADSGGGSGGGIAGTAVSLGVRDGTSSTSAAGRAGPPEAPGRPPVGAVRAFCLAAAIRWPLPEG